MTRPRPLAPPSLARSPAPAPAATPPAAGRVAEARRRAAAGLGALAGLGSRPLLGGRVLLGTGLALPGAASAQPDLDKPVGPTLADRGNRLYRFSRSALVSEDGERRYRLVIGVPRRPPPRDGFPLALLLDGNAALAALTDAMLGRVDSTGRLPVIAALGYETDKRFDVAARTYDYTPARPDAPNATRDPARGLRAGGAETFLAFIESKVKPKLREAARLDEGRLALWGHSYGGLFALHVLFTRPASFSRYAAADPALWWQDGLILRTEASAARLPARETRLFVMTGRGAARAAPPAAGPRDGAGADASPAARMNEARRAVAPDEIQRMVERQTRRANLVITHQVFQGMEHGPLLAASLEPALRFAARH